MSSDVPSGVSELHRWARQQNQEAKMNAFKSVLITLVLGHLMLTASAADPVGDSPLANSPALKIGQEFSVLLGEEDFPNVYRRLHESYARYVREEDFLESVRSADIHTLLVAPITASLSERTGYIVVRVVSERGGVQNERTAVMFVMKEGDRWMLLNYPFAPGHLPEFFQEPCFVCEPRKK